MQKSFYHVFIHKFLCKQILTWTGSCLRNRKQHITKIPDLSVDSMRIWQQCFLGEVTL